MKLFQVFVGTPETQ